MTLEKRGLGRGLASLIPQTPKAPIQLRPLPQAGQVVPTTEVEISRIIHNPVQPRKLFKDEKLKELSDSISEKGILQPLLVQHKNGEYHLIAGERRLRAAKMAGLSKVPVIVRDVAPNDFLELALIENIQRQDLNPIEEAGAYQDLMNRFSYTQDDVAKKVGKDRSSVANFLRLLKLPDKIKQAVLDEKISMGHARALAGVPEIERQFYLFDKVTKEEWSVRELEDRIAITHRVPKRNRPKQEPSTQIASITEELKKKYGTQVKIASQGKKGRIVIDFYSWEDLDRIYQQLVR